MHKLVCLGDSCTRFLNAISVLYWVGIRLYVVSKSSGAGSQGFARLGSARVCKLVCVGQEEAEKLGRGRLGLLGKAPRLGLLGSVPWAPPSRGLPSDPTRGLIGVRATDVTSLTSTYDLAWFQGPRALSLGASIDGSCVKSTDVVSNRLTLY
ncbi:hypothetical protein BHM03_00057848 [Ensete ventricosum]|nr:hypothetical protein BHM03_00057848 [Ensete ventricosum]